MQLKIGVIEDEQRIREGLAVLINGSDGFLCEHIFENAEAAIKEIPSLHLDVVLVDIHLPGKSGIECVAELKAICPNTQFVMLTAIEDSESVLRSLKSGATGYLTKTTQPSKILEALTDVYKGGSPMSSHIARKVVSSFNAYEKIAEFDKLSMREKEILTLLSEGHRYKEIAEIKILSTETVRTHIRNIYEKLQVNSRIEALNKVYKR